MFRKFVSILFLVGVAGLCSIPTNAADNRGSICIIPTCEGSRITDGQVSLYPIGATTAEETIQPDKFLGWTAEESWEGETVCQMVDETGATFTGLEEGIYLVVQSAAASGFSKFQPFLVSLPMQTHMAVTITPEVRPLSEPPRTGDYPAPIYTAMMLSLGIVFFLVLVENRKK